ncbi:hypothetical protein ACGFNV_34875 [Streptomyces sp. NPDC048751]|uniref:SCO2400 family protein n=1 Tax=Streptomyces sp. NPDC048751 TaxID=3365591 RepID=UPI0037102C9E
MDYCSSCRRHLNGALVCPGCGAYAPDIAPTTADGRTVPGPATVGTTAAWAPEPDTWPDGGRHGGGLHADGLHDGLHGALHEEADGGLHGAGTDEDPYGEPSGDLEGVASAPEGRAARRRQRARWKKNQRRAVVATAVALVGGGLTLGTMDRNSTNRAQAATAPEVTGPGTDEERTSQDALPTSTRPDAHRSSPTPTAPAIPRQRSVAPDEQDALSNVQPDSADRPRTAAKPVPQPQAGSRNSGGSAAGASTSGGSGSGGSADDSGTAATPTPTPTGGADSSSNAGGDSSGSGTSSSSSSSSSSGTSQSGTSQSGTSPSATSPSGEICVLVLCLG